MIKTKGGVQVKIVSGSKKSITGRHPFTVEAIIPAEILLKNMAIGGKIESLGKRFKLTKSELVYDNEQELWDSLGLVKE
jgi:hypothetical protein